MVGKLLKWAIITVVLVYALGFLFNGITRGFQHLLGVGLLSFIISTFVNFAILVIALSYVVKKFKGEDDDDSCGTHGSARLANKNELKDLKIDNGLLIGRDRKSGKLLRYADSSHLLTIAPTRTGKGVGTIIPNLLTLDRSVICIDPKGENAKIARRARASLGAVRVLDPFNVVDNKTDAFNPLQGLDAASMDIADDVATLADALVYDPPGEAGEAHWNEEAKALISGIILYVIATQSPQRRTLATLREYLTASPADFAALLDQMQASGTLAYGLIARAANRHLGKSDREASGVVSAAQRHTHFLDSVRMANVMSHSDFSFVDLKRGNVTVFLVLPPERLAAYSRWLRLMISQSLRDLSTDRIKPVKPILYLLDEFAALGYLAPIEQAMGLMAGYGIQLWPILQDIHQLRGTYGKRADTFLSNAGVLQFFGVTDHESAQLVSNLLGQTTIVYETMAGRKFMDAGSMSEQRSARALFTPDEVRMLPSDQQLIFIAGRAPIRAKKLRYYEDKEFQGRYDPA